MKRLIPFIAASVLLSLHMNVHAVEEYQRADNACGKEHANKSGDKKDAAIARCIQERYKGQRASGTEEVEHAKRKQCNAGPDSKNTDCEPEQPKQTRSTSEENNKGRQLKKLGEGGLDTSGGTHSGSSNKPQSSTNTSGGVNTGNSESPHKSSK